MTSRVQPEVPSRVALLIVAVVAAATASIALTLDDARTVLETEPWSFLAFLGFTVALQAFAVDVHGRGRVGVGGIGMLAAAFALGPGPAVLIAAAPVATNLALRRRAPFYRYAFDGAMWVATTGAAAATYSALNNAGRIGDFMAAIAAGAVFVAVNNGLLCAAIGLSEGLSPRHVWRERFRWARYHYAAFGVLAFAAAHAYNAVGFAGLIAFGLPPALLILSFREYVERTRRALEEVREANDALSRANAALGESRDDMRELFEFAGGLAAHATDRNALRAYAQEAITRLAETAATIDLQSHAPGTPLSHAGHTVATFALDHAAAHPRWARIRDAALPHLATALESAALVERVRRTHLQTIAALSKSMEAKDGYTGDHTERVAELAVALAERLGYAGDELHAIEVGALLHDIGKIAVPESILHKPGPLDDNEWEVMKQHPVTSEYILSGIDLHPIVLEIARSSHERIDGKGYPDGLAGNEVPLPARIVLVADAFDALTSNRPYRARRHPRAALDEIRSHAGTQFCPTVLRALEALFVERPKIVGLGLRRVAA